MLSRRALHHKHFAVLATTVTAGGLLGCTTSTSPGESPDAAAASFADAAQAAPVPSIIEVTPSDFTIDVGASQQLGARVLDQMSRPIPGAVVTWTSGDVSRATVTSSGLVAAVGEGEVTITATLGSATGIATGQLAAVLEAPNPVCCTIAADNTPKGQEPNLCFVGPNTADCYMTMPGGYCDPNGDGSYTEPGGDISNWETGYYHYQDACAVE